MRRIIAIVDPDSEYAGRLAQYINKTETGGMKAVIFSDTDKYRARCSDYDIRILLIDEAEYSKLHEEDTRGIVICLSEDSFSSSGIAAVNKYSRADIIIRFMMGEYAEHAPSALAHISLKPSHTIAIYSPVNRCGKTAFAITMSQILGQRGSCLLLVLDEFSGVLRYIASEATSDFSDVVYAYKQGRYSWAKLSETVCRFGSTDYIAPVRYPEDLSMMTPVQMIELLTKIKSESKYDYLILDMGSYGKHAAELSEICDEIFMPVMSDEISRCKVNEYREALELSGRADILNRIREVELPHDKRLDGASPSEEVYGYGSLFEFTGGLFPDTAESE